LFSEKIRKGWCRVMTVEIDVERVDGKAVILVAWIGDIKSKWICRPDTGEPYEVSRINVEVQVLDQDTLWISPGDYRDLYRTVNKVFSEDRSKSLPRKKKLQSELQGELF